MKIVNADVLEQWAKEAALDPYQQTRPGERSLRERIQNFRSESGKGPLPGNMTGETLHRKPFAALSCLIEHIPENASLQLSSGGVRGIDANIIENVATLLGLAGLPSVSAGPDIANLKGRHGLIELGSAEHGGFLFIGADERRSWHLGSSAFIGWSLMGGHVLAGISAGAARGSNRSAPEGVMIWTRRDSPEESGTNDAWRNKLIQVLSSVGSGSGSLFPRTANQMWDRLVYEHSQIPTSG